MLMWSTDEKDMASTIADPHHKLEYLAGKTPFTSAMISTAACPAYDPKIQ